MRNKSITKSNSGLNSWMDEFLVGMAQKLNLTKTASDETVEVEGDVQEEEQEVLAEVNIHDLEKVIWNDETFYVQFDNVGADVFNEFGNVVTSLKGVFSIADVDNALNGKQVVVSSTETEDLQANTEFEDELAKAVSYLDEAEETIASVDPNESDIFDQEDATDEDLNDEVVTLAEVTEEVVADETAGEEVLAEEEDLFTEAIASGFETLEAKIAALEEMVTQMGQQYARSQEVQSLDNGSEVEEQKHYEETAAATQQQINSDNAIDLTTPQGRVELSQHTHEEVTNTEVEETPTENTETEVSEPNETVEETTQEETEEVTEEPTEEPTEEAPIEEVPTEEAEVTEETAVEAPMEEQIPEATEVQTEEEATEETVEEPSIKTLSSVESNIFKNAVCPSCGEKSLTLSKVASNMQGIYCGGCPSEYAVNLDTEEIFIFKG